MLAGLVDEGFEAITLLWSGEPVSFQGQYVTIETRVPAVVVNATRVGGQPDDGLVRHLPTRCSTAQRVSGTVPSEVADGRTASWADVAVTQPLHLSEVVVG